MKKPVKNCTYEKETLEFLESYKNATGNNFSETNEYFVKLGIANMEEIQRLEEAHFSSIQKLENKISILEASLKKQANRLAAIQVHETKIAGASLYLLKEIFKMQGVQEDKILQIIRAGEKYSIDTLSSSKNTDDYSEE